MSGELSSKCLREGATSPDSADLFTPLFTVAHGCALQSGLSYEDSEDCALAFVQHALDSERIRVTLTTTPEDFYLRRCAMNWALDHRRRIVRRKKHETTYSELECQENVEDDAPKADNSLLRNELWERVFRCVEQLAVSQQRLFLLRYVQHRSIQEIAAQQGQTPHAIEQSLSTLRFRLRQLLAEQGFDKAEASEYLAMFTPPPSFYIDDVEPIVRYIVTIQP